MVPTAWDLGGGVPMRSGPQAGDLLIHEDNLPIQILVLYHDFGGRWDRGQCFELLALNGPVRGVDVRGDPQAGNLLIQADY
jgi:hypothetical protein